MAEENNIAVVLETIVPIDEKCKEILSVKDEIEDEIEKNLGIPKSLNLQELPKNPVKAIEVVKALTPDPPKRLPQNGVIVFGAGIDPDEWSKRARDEGYEVTQMIGHAVLFKADKKKN